MPEAGRLLQTIDALEAERARLSQLLHDRIAQSLSAAGLQLDLVRMDLADGAAAVPGRVAAIQDLIEKLMTQVRDVYRELYPSSAGRIGLRAALDGLAGNLRTGFPGNVRVFADSSVQPAPAIAEAMYRIAQEAATVAARREGCSVIEILVKSSRNGPALEVWDNASAGVENGCSLRNGWLELLLMQHFAEKAGIQLEIEDVPGKGSVVRVVCQPEANLVR